MLACADPLDLETVVFPHAGGVITAAGGRLVINVPSGALLVDTEGCISHNPIAPEASALVEGSVYSIGRPSTHFAQHVTVTIFYNAHALPLGVTESGLNVYRLLGHRWSLLTGSALDSTHHSISFTTTQTGTYAVIGSSNANLYSNSFLLPKTRSVYAGSLPLTYIENLGATCSFDAMDSNLASYRDLYTIQGAIPNSFLNQCENALYFVKQQPSGSIELYETALDGSDPVRISALGATAFLGMDSSPDGSVLALYLTIHSTPYLVLMNADGSHVVVGPHAAGFSGHPAFSHDGQQVAFATNSGIGVISLNGAITSSLSLGGLTPRQVCWNPSGDTLAFSAYSGSTSNTALYTWPVASHAYLQRSQTTGLLADVSWSPDGTTIAVTRDDGQSYVDLQLYSATGTNATYTSRVSLSTAYSLVWR